MKARAEIVVSGVAVGIDMDHAERPISGNGPQDWQRDRMITADRQRRYASRMNGSEEGGDFGERPLQLEGPFDPGVSQIGDADEVEGRHAGRLIDLADERRLVADVARAMARAWAVGDATVERHADEADVDLIEPHAVGEAEEGGNSAIARLQLRIGQFRIAPNLLHHAEAPFGKDLPVVNAERPVYVEQSLAAWLMSGTQIYQTGAHGIVPTSLEYRRPARLQWRWQVRLWRNSSGNAAIWLLNGLQVLQTGVSWPCFRQ